MPLHRMSTAQPIRKHNAHCIQHAPPHDDQQLHGHEYQSTLAGTHLPAEPAVSSTVFSPLPLFTLQHSQSNVASDSAQSAAATTAEISPWAVQEASSSTEASSRSPLPYGGQRVGHNLLCVHHLPVQETLLPPANRRGEVLVRPHVRPPACARPVAPEGVRLQGKAGFLVLNHCLSSHQ